MGELRKGCHCSIHLADYPSKQSLQRLSKRAEFPQPIVLADGIDGLRCGKLFLKRVNMPNMLLRRRHQGDRLLEIGDTPACHCQAAVVIVVAESCFAAPHWKFRAGLHRRRQILPPRSPEFLRRGSEEIMHRRQFNAAPRPEALRPETRVFVAAFSTPASRPYTSAATAMAT